MKLSKKAISCFFGLLLSMIACSHVELEDNFEEQRASFWSADSRSGNSAPWSSVVRFEGRSAYRFLVKKGDKQTKSDIKTGTERSEIYLDPDQYGDSIGDEIWYSFGLFVPEDFPITDTRVVLGQWKSDDKQDPSYSPPISNRIKLGKFSVKIKTQQGEQEFPLPTFKLGAWNDLIYRIILSPEKGELDIWLNGSKEVSFRGSTANIDRVHLFKMGVYRDTFAEDMVVYFSNFRRSRSSLLR